MNVEYFDHDADEAITKEVDIDPKDLPALIKEYKRKNRIWANKEIFVNNRMWERNHTIECTININKDGVSIFIL